MPAPTFEKALETYQKLPIGKKAFTFDSSSNWEIRARQCLDYLKQVEAAFASIGITDEAHMTNIFKLIEFDLCTKAGSAIDDDQVTATTPWKTLKQKLEKYFFTAKLKAAARRKLRNYKQGPNQSPFDVKTEILQLWTEAGWPDQDKEAHIKHLVLQALTEHEVQLQYEYSLMPGRTELTLNQIVTIANVYATNKKPSTSFSVNQTSYGQRGFGRSRRGFSRPKNFNKCTNCGSNEQQHSTKLAQQSLRSAILATG